MNFLARFQPTVLVIGEEEAFLLPPAPEPPLFFSRNEASENLAQNLSPRARLLVLADLMSAEIRGEKIPPAPWRDRPKLLARRLRKIFPETEQTAILEIQKNRAAFAALHSGSSLATWKKILAELPNRTIRFALLPSVLLRFFRLCAPEAHEEWHLLLSEQRIGGWRQLVVHQGLPVFTRLTAPTGGTAEEKAETLRRDLLATIEYLPRLGFRKDETLAGFFLLSDAVQKSLRRLSLPLEVRFLTPKEATIKGGLGSYPLETSDFLLAAFAQQKARPVLLATPQKGRAPFRFPRQAWIAPPVAAAIAIFFLFGVPRPAATPSSLPSITLALPTEILYATPAAAKEETPKEALHLEALMYLGPNKWSFWLNGMEWTPTTDRPALHVIEVQPDAVHFSTTDEKTAPHDLWLHPNQIFDPETGQVEEIFENSP